VISILYAAETFSKVTFQVVLLPVNLKLGQQPREPTGVDGPYGQDARIQFYRD